MFAEFKAFIAKGNVLELAVAVIIAGGFGTIVTSLTQDVIMPIVGYIFGGADFSSYFILLSIPAEYDGSTTDYAALKEAGAAMIGYGALMTATTNFVILAFIIFLLVRYANRVQTRFAKHEFAKHEEAAAAAEPAGPSEIELLTEIRDALRKCRSFPRPLHINLGRAI